MHNSELSIDLARRLRIGVACVLLSLAFVFGWQRLGLVPALASSHACLASPGGIQIHYGLGSNRSGDVGIESVELSGFDPETCDGAPARVTLSGNQAGDPAGPADEQLAVLDTALSPCTGAEVDPAHVISGGSLTLRACSTLPSPTGAAYADLHDVTRIQIEVDGNEVPLTPAVDESPDSGPDVLGVQQFAYGSGSGVTANSGASGGDLMPATGGPRSLMLWSGMLLLLLGVISLAWDLLRPRSNAPTGRGPGAH